MYILSVNVICSLFTGNVRILLHTIEENFSWTCLNTVENMTIAHVGKLPICFDNIFAIFANMYIFLKFPYRIIIVKKGEISG